MLSIVSVQSTAFAGSAMGSSKVAPQMKAPAQAEFAYGLPGGDNILGEFDPAGFMAGKSKLEVYRLREAELAHGRVSMLAAVGFLVQEKFHPLFSGDGGPAIDQFAKLPVIMWPLITIFIGGCESLRISKGWSNPNEPEHVFQKLLDNYVPGDIGFDPLGLKPTDPAEFRIMQTKELQNGRLGMLAAAGFLAQEAVSDTTWGTYWGLPDL
uniref:Uncharacterized protein n=1 Tax=Phaeocystis antarctica TaxID=33657 RepID=A0A7S0I2K0_9EUKA